MPAIGNLEKGAIIAKGLGKHCGSEVRADCKPWKRSDLRSLIREKPAKGSGLLYQGDPDAGHSGASLKFWNSGGWGRKIAR